MRTNRIAVTVATAGLTAAGILCATAGTAAANPTVAVVGGRERIKVTVTNDLAAKVTCQSWPLGKSGKSVSVDPTPSKGSMVLDAPVGDISVWVTCVSGGKQVVNGKFGPVTVSAADAAKDAQDKFLLGLGSSGMVSDQTLVP